VSCCPPCCSNPRSLGSLAAVGVLVFVADQLFAWVADRIWWIAGTVVLCFALAFAAATAIGVCTERREARFAVRHGILSRADVERAEAAQIGKPIAVLPLTVVPAELPPAGAATLGLGHTGAAYEPESAVMPQRNAPPAFGPPPKSWLCETCYWAWPLDLPFCGVCGHSRSTAGADREVIIRQAINGRN
jgi:hypothetical protein